MYYVLYLVRVPIVLCFHMCALLSNVNRICNSCFELSPSVCYPEQEGKFMKC